MIIAKTVLVAEDDANDAFLLRRAFSCAELCCSLIHVANGRLAADYLTGAPPYLDRTQYPLPGLLITDLNMPLMDGWDLLDWLQGRPDLKHLPAIVLSSCEAGNERARALKLGARAYHVKPLRFFELTALVRQFERHFVRQE